MRGSGAAGPKPARAGGTLSERALALFRRLRGRAVLAAHRLAARLDLVPPEFGREAPVDEDDPKAVVDEWVRYLRLWADYNPEEVFALKIGAALLLAAAIAIWLAVALLL